MRRLLAPAVIALLLLTSTSAARAQSCPSSYFSLGGLGFYEEFPTAPRWSNSGFSYDLVPGTLQGAHTGWGETGSFAALTARDRYRVVGPASASPIAFQVRVRFTGTVGGDIVTLPDAGAQCLGSTARLRLAEGSLVDEATVASDFSPACGPRTIDETLELALARLPEEEFTLAVGLSLSAGHTIGAAVSGGITFEGLPPGYSIQSCQGYAGPAVAVRPLSWGRVKQIYR